LHYLSIADDNAEREEKREDTDEPSLSSFIGVRDREEDQGEGKQKTFYVLECSLRNDRIL